MVTNGKLENALYEDFVDNAVNKTPRVGVHVVPNGT